MAHSDARLNCNAKRVLLKVEFPDFLYQYPGLLMPRKIDWDNQIGRRLRLRDLHLFFAVVQRGSMAKAATHLGISQPAVSEVIADLEHTLGVRLFDRSSQGVEPTIYGRALLKRGEAAFDELKQGIRDIEFLADPSKGEVRIGCAESIAASILPTIIEQVARLHPGLVSNVTQVGNSTTAYPELHERKLDVVIGRITPHAPAKLDDDLQVEILFHDKLVLATGKSSRWARRRKIDLREIINDTWILTPPGTFNNVLVGEAFRARGLEMPKISVMTYSVHLRTHLLAGGHFITAIPLSTLRLNADRFELRELPIDLPVRSWPVAIMTLKNRTLSPVVERFIECARAATRSFITQPRARKI
jgi:DNA-binding transcriptional LysR family regulator